MSMKNPLTPAGIEPATFQFVAQHFNHCATAVMYGGYYNETMERVPKLCILFMTRQELRDS